jgi:hypothetical protein
MVVTWYISVGCRFETSMVHVTCVVAPEALERARVDRRPTPRWDRRSERPVEIN